MDLLLQQIINALSLGGIYAMLALGLAIVFSIVRLINFAHGEIMTFGGYGIFLSMAFGFPPLAALAIGIGAALVMALAMERAAFRAMRGADVVSLLITSFAVSEILKVLFQNGISARPVPISFPSSWSGTYQIAGMTIGVAPTVSILVTLTSLGALTFVLRRTPMGMAMRAAAEDFEMLRMLGLKANRVVAVSFAISGLLAGVAAVIWTAQRGSVDPMMGFFPVLKAFIATVLGGLGSLGGAVLGGFVVGGLEVLTQAFLPDNLAPYRDAIVLSAVIAALLIRPDGLLPAKTGHRS
ncbi:MULTISPECIES: branched-chain amino acid ABC transporter permease [unclassified Roseovarius]|uniref:branched-chain amino acid ABC transporter permease n=1 Tax=unclassified Roseovarius TaxID=2614913 RepID=UPI00273F4B6D|nr:MULTISPECIES: branched-chain amino acid ABC transporter permease [unclassified Roseovarius]